MYKRSLRSGTKSDHPDLSGFSNLPVESLHGGQYATLRSIIDLFTVDVP